VTPANRVSLLDMAEVMTEVIDQAVRNRRDVKGEVRFDQFQAMLHEQLEVYLPYLNTGVYVGNARASGLSGDLVYHALIAGVAESLREIPEWHRLTGCDVDEVIRELVEHVRRVTPRGNRVVGPIWAPTWPQSSPRWRSA